MIHHPFLKPLLLAAVVAVLMVAATDPALASAAGGPGLPWEAPLTTLSNSIKGPVAFAISLLGIIVCGALLIWGGEISEFMRRSVMLVLVIALLVLATNVLSTLFATAAVVS
ncbi:MAG TPA: TrbC/VirB2 family protein [Patescibacteria group bacterium]|nr:TrbC/VirB2 family protein [Patescibacteria group bacterium]